MKRFLLLVVYLVVALLLSVVSAGHSALHLATDPRRSRREALDADTKTHADHLSKYYRHFPVDKQVDSHQEEEKSRATKDGSFSHFERDGDLYKYAYAVRDGSDLDFAHKEKNDEEGTVVGSYSVLLPDGRLQVVTYRSVPGAGIRTKVTHLQPEEFQKLKEESDSDDSDSDDDSDGESIYTSDESSDDDDDDDDDDEEEDEKEEKEDGADRESHVEEQAKQDLAPVVNSEVSRAKTSSHKTEQILPQEESSQKSENTLNNEYNSINSDSQLENNISEQFKRIRDRYFLYKSA